MCTGTHAPHARDRNCTNAPPYAPSTHTPDTTRAPANTHTAARDLAHTHTRTHHPLISTHTIAHARTRVRAHTVRAVTPLTHQHAPTRAAPTAEPASRFARLHATRARRARWPPAASLALLPPRHNTSHHTHVCALVPRCGFLSQGKLPFLNDAPPPCGRGRFRALLRLRRWLHAATRHTPACGSPAGRPRSCARPASPSPRARAAAPMRLMHTRTRK
ncbi:MAG: hypothetical protein J3K34DRAFT_436035 [Monoraphidium minutum]|nr:MAG: hypothetical protein J3K34DRAFT_436035 [Monoraphidium minutum]